MKERFKPKCKLIGKDGNIFNLMGLASKALRDAGMGQEAKDMIKEVTEQESYEDALVVIMDYVDVY